VLRPGCDGCDRRRHRIFVMPIGDISYARVGTPGYATCGPNEIFVARSRDSLLNISLIYASVNIASSSRNVRRKVRTAQPPSLGSQFVKTIERISRDFHRPYAADRNGKRRVKSLRCPLGEQLGDYIGRPRWQEGLYTAKRSPRSRVPTGTRAVQMA
jgi:hypothetical protein